MQKMSLGPEITRVAEGQVKRIELYDKVYVDNARLTTWINYSSNKIINVDHLFAKAKCLPHGFKEVTNNQECPSRFYV